MFPKAFTWCDVVTSHYRKFGFNINGFVNQLFDAGYCPLVYDVPVGCYNLNDFIWENHFGNAKYVWIFGNAGTGKTRFIQDNFSNIYYMNWCMSFWVGYTGQEIVCCDDCSSTCSSFKQMVMFMSSPEQSFLVSCGIGASSYLMEIPPLKRVIIISNENPLLVFRNYGLFVRHLFNRFKVVEFSLSLDVDSLNEIKMRFFN